MITYQGEKVAPDGDGAPTLYTIGVATGRIARFCGHTKHFYTVLGHMLTVAAILPAEYGLFGLLHDAPEACVADVPTPWKTQVARNREHRLLKRIYNINGLEWPIPEEAQEAVDEADRLALIAEAHVLEHPAAEVLWPDTPDPTAVEFTEFHLEKVEQFLIPQIAGPIYEEAFKTYREKRNRSLAAKAAYARKLVETRT